jgi:hypothetical protein
MQPRPQASAQTSIMKALAAQLIVLMLSAARAEVPCFDIPGCSPYYAWLAANLLAVRAVTFPCLAERRVPSQHTQLLHAWIASGHSLHPYAACFLVFSLFAVCHATTKPTA